MSATTLLGQRASFGELEAGRLAEIGAENRCPRLENSAIV